MDFEEYQTAAESTAMYPDEYRITYPVLGLAGEAGELPNKWKKVLRDDNGLLTLDKRNAMLDELGDILWYIALVARDLDSDINEVADININKLRDRYVRGVIGGSGDNR